MDILDKLKSQIGDDVQHIFDHEALFKAARDEITALRARLEAVEKERDNETIKRAGWELEARIAEARAERAEAALATARRDAWEWNDDMSAAPKDGTAVLLYCPGYPGEIQAAVWNTRREEWCAQACDNLSFAFDEDDGPTKWMPFPDPPEPKP